MTYHFKLKTFLYVILITCVCYFIYSFYKTTNSNNTPQHVIIIGATSGIGEALARKYVTQGHYVAITGRRKDRLDALKSELGKNCIAHVMDIAQTEAARNGLQELINDMNGIDTIIISAGIGSTDFSWEKQQETIAVNVTGFVALANLACDYFVNQDYGHLVGISSIFALRGSSGSPVYSASKAFESNYLEGLRAHYKKKGIAIYITDIQPGLVDTAMGQASDFWRATPEEAAEQIYKAVSSKCEHAYVTKRWRLIAWLFKFLPDSIFYKIF